MKTTGLTNKRHETRPRADADRVLECAGGCGQVTMLSRREAKRAARWTWPTCHPAREEEAVELRQAA